MKLPPSKIAKMLLFVVVVVGTLLAYIPVALGIFGPSAPPVGWSIAGAAAFWAVGGALAGWVTVEFIRNAGGTPAPPAPTDELVVRGLYRYSRNPMYVGAVLIVIGWAFWYRSWVIGLYAVALAMFFHGLVTMWEEPGLKERFGDGYEAYLASAPRWFGLPKSGRGDRPAGPSA